MKQVKSFKVEIILIAGYLLADTLHLFSFLFVDVILHGTYTLQEAIYFPMNYLAGPSVLTFWVIRKELPKDVNNFVQKKYLRTGLLIVSIRDLLAEIAEFLNWNIPLLRNIHFTLATVFKIGLIFSFLIISLYIDKKCKYSKSPLFLQYLLGSVMLFIWLLYIYIRISN